MCVCFLENLSNVLLLSKKLGLFSDFEIHSHILCREHDFVKRAGMTTKVLCACVCG